MGKKNACLYYSDLDFHDKGIIKWFSCDYPHPDKDKILTYLCSGEWDGQICSAWNPKLREYKSVDLWTDGEWVWDEYLIDHVWEKTLKSTMFFYNT